MREILYRGKDLNENWIYGGFYQWNNKAYIIQKDIWDNSRENANIIEVIPETVGQLTGLTDKNGVKIFENDTVKFKEHLNGKFCWIGKVVYEKTQWCIVGNANEECDTPFTVALSRLSSDMIEVLPEIIND